MTDVGNTTPSPHNIRYVGEAARIWLRGIRICRTKVDGKAGFPTHNQGSWYFADLVLNRVDGASNSGAGRGACLFARKQRFALSD